MTHDTPHQHDTLPIILQSESAECGLACLAMISGYFGHKVDLPTVRNEIGAVSQGANLKQLLTLGEKFKLTGRALKLELSELRELELPAVLHWNLSHFVVLKEISGRKCVIHDPAVGVRAYSIKEMSKRFSGIALEFHPSADFKIADDRGTLRLTDMFFVFKTLHPSIIQVAVLSFLAQLCVLFVPFYMILSLQLGLSTHDPDWLVVLTSAFGIVLLSKTVVEFLRGQATIYITSRIGYQIASNLFHHLLRLPVQYFEGRRLGSLIGQVLAADQLKRLLGREVVLGIIDGLFSIISLVTLYFFSPLLLSITVGAFAILVLHTILCDSSNRQLHNGQVEGFSRYQSWLITAANTMVSTKVQATEQTKFKDWQKSFVEMSNAGIAFEKRRVLDDSVKGFFFGLENIVVMYVGALLVNNYSLSIGQYLGFIYLKQVFGGSLLSFVSKVAALREIPKHLDEISEVVMTKPEFESFETKPFRPEIRGTLQLENVCFRYSESDKRVIRDANLRIEAGEVVILRGPSGSGKSTLLKLMCGLLEPTSGTVRVDGSSISNYGVREYRSRIAAVFHTSKLEPGSVRQNIAIDDEHVDQQLIESVAKLVRIHEHIASLPMAYYTPVGELSSSLSAGQVQRVILARALYTKPCILFLDEAMANMESELTVEIVRSISSLGITVIMVTHSEFEFSGYRQLVVQDGAVYDIRALPTKFDQVASSGALASTSNSATG